MYFCTTFFVCSATMMMTTTMSKRKKVYKLKTIFSSRARKSIIKTLERKKEGWERRDVTVALLAHQATFYHDTALEARKIAENFSPHIASVVYQWGVMSSPPFSMYSRFKDKKAGETRASSVRHSYKPCKIGQIDHRKQLFIIMSFIMRRMWVDFSTIVETGFFAGSTAITKTNTVEVVALGGFVVIQFPQTFMGAHIRSAGSPQSSYDKSCKQATTALVQLCWILKGVQGLVLK